jgi:hypothetical protein
VRQEIGWFLVREGMPLEEEGSGLQRKDVKDWLAAAHRLLGLDTTETLLQACDSGEFSMVSVFHGRRIVSSSRLCYIILWVSKSALSQTVCLPALPCCNRLNQVGQVGLHFEAPRLPPPFQTSGLTFLERCGRHTIMSRKSAQAHKCRISTYD